MVGAGAGIGREFVPRDRNLRLTCRCYLKSEQREAPYRWEASLN